LVILDVRAVEQRATAADRLGSVRTVAFARGDEMHIVLTCRPSFAAGWRVELHLRQSDGVWQLESGPEFPALPGAKAVTRQDRLLTNSEAAALATLLETVRLPLVPEYAMGMDGMGWAFELDHGFNCVHLEWWPGLPEAWGGISDLLGFMAGFAGATID
jgi:hypothetical protein